MARSGHKELMLLVTEHGAGLAAVRLDDDAATLDSPLFVRPATQKRDDLALADEAVISRLAEHVRTCGWRGRRVCCVVGGNVVTSQSFEVPALKPAALRNAVQLKIAQQLVYDVREAILWTQSLDASNDTAAGSAWVAAVAIHRRQTECLVAACERLGLVMDRITALPNALARIGLAAHGVTGSGLELLLQMGEFAGTLIVYRDGRARVNTDLSFGLADLTKALMRPIMKDEDVIQLDEAAARKLRDEAGVPAPGSQIESLSIPAERVIPLLQPALQNLTKQVMQWLAFARGADAREPLVLLCVSGPGARIPGLAETLAGRLGAGPESVRRLRPIGSDCDPDIEELVPVLGAVGDPHDLPDLVPGGIRREQLLERYRRKGILISPAIAAGLLIVTFLLRQVTGSLTSAQASQTQALSRSQTELARWQAWQANARDTEAMRRALEAFHRDAPSWDSILKEFSIVLPSAVRMTGLSAQRFDDRLVMRLTSDLYDVDERSTFNALVEQTLAVLQGSPFFERVEVVSATRAVGRPQTGRVVGTLTLDLTLAYPHAPGAATGGKR